MEVEDDGYSICWRTFARTQSTDAVRSRNPRTNPPRSNLHSFRLETKERSTKNETRDANPRFVADRCRGQAMFRRGDEFGIQLHRGQFRAFLAVWRIADPF